MEKMKYCTTFVADKNKPVTSFSYHLKEAWIEFLCIVILHFVKTWREWSRDMKIHISA